MKQIKYAMIGASALFLGACSSTTESISQSKESFEQWVLDRHVEKSSMSRGNFCDGQGFKWYHESKNYINFTCKDGSSFSLRKE